MRQRPTYWLTPKVWHRPCSHCDGPTSIAYRAADKRTACAECVERLGIRARPSRAWLEGGSKAGAAVTVRRVAPRAASGAATIALMADLRLKRPETDDMRAAYHELRAEGHLVGEAAVDIGRGLRDLLPVNRPDEGTLSIPTQAHQDVVDAILDRAEKIRARYDG